MLFSRQSNDTTNETYYSLVRRPPFITNALALSVSATTLIYAGPSGARPSRRAEVRPSHTKLNKSAVSNQTVKASEPRLTGVWGWTTGSQTYLRVRPSADVPAVAKVPQRTKLFVWGTFDGWYRVETPDHIFGWIFNKYVNAPGHEHLQELSHSKAKAASDRAAHQTMYASPDVLLRYYARYGAPGARRGLTKQGVRLAGAAKPRSSVKVATRTVKPRVAPVTVAARPLQKSTPKITVRTTVAPRPRTPAPRVAAAVVTAPPVLKVSAPPVLKVSAPSLQTQVRVVTPPRVAPKAAPKPVQAAKPKRAKASWRAVALKRRQLRQQRERERLRRRLGTPVMAAPPLSAPGLAPISPEELMNAREAFVTSRNGTNTPAAQPGQPSTPAPSSGGLYYDNPALLRPSSFTASRGGSRKAKVPLNRGGSPRDYITYSAKPSFNQGIANQAMSYRGMPYIRGAESPRRGFDCSGLVYFLLRQRGYNPPRTAAGYAHYGQSVGKGKLQPGDILLFSNTYKRGISHMGIYVGNGKFVHAARTGQGVRVDSLTSSYYGHKYSGARRVKAR